MDFGGQIRELCWDLSPKAKPYPYKQDKKLGFIFFSGHILHKKRGKKTLIFLLSNIDFFPLSDLSLSLIFISWINKILKTQNFPLLTFFSQNLDFFLVPFPWETQKESCRHASVYNHHTYTHSFLRIYKNKWRGREREMNGTYGRASWWIKLRSVQS